MTNPFRKGLCECFLHYLGSDSEISDLRARKLRHSLRFKTENVMRRARSGPDQRELQQIAVKPSARRRDMPQRRDAADGKAGLCPDQRGIGFAQRLPGQRRGLFQIDLLRARGDEQQRRRAVFAAQND